MSIRAFPLSILGPTEWPAVVIFHPKPACLPFFNSQSQYAISASPHNNYMGCCKDQLSARHCPVYSTHRGQMDQLQTVCSALHCWWPGKLGTSSDTRMTEGRSWDLWHNQYFQNTSYFMGATCEFRDLPFTDRCIIHPWLCYQLTQNLVWVIIKLCLRTNVKIK